MAWSFLNLHPKTIDDHLRAIEQISTEAADFWKSAHGWAPDGAADLLSKARLDWLASFSRTLKLRVYEVNENPNEPAVLILAWAHLRTLVEGHLKLFLTVFLADYLTDIHAPVHNGQPIEPQLLKFENIRQFLIKRGLLINHHGFIAAIQQRGNAIHAFADKSIGTASEYLEYVALYREFLTDVVTALPNPYH
jgi:hypothetical protein